MNAQWIGMGLLAGAMTLAAQSGKEWEDSSKADKKYLGLKGANPYFNLTPGWVVVLAHGKDTQTQTVLAETKMIDGVECRVVENREMKNGRLTEVTRDYFAIDYITDNVYYMGEDVDVYKDGKVVGHGGAWMSGRNGARFGLLLPGLPKVGQRFQQEQAPGAAMDRGEILAVEEKVSTPAGSFDRCVRVEETSALGKGAKDQKVYCPGVGMVRDGEMLLMKYSAK